MRESSRRSVLADLRRISSDSEIVQVGNMRIGNEKSASRKRSRSLGLGFWADYGQALPYRLGKGCRSAAENQKTSVWRFLNFHLHIAGTCLNECGDNLVPTEGWGDRSQNCLHHVRIVGNTELIWDG
jgi:hypothetical protein